MVIETERAEIEARARVTERMRPLRIEGRDVHQVALPWHWGFGGASPGDSANDLGALGSDPNVSIQEDKAFTCNVRAGRRGGETTARLSGRARRQPRRARQRRPVRGHGAVMTEIADRARRTPSGWASSPTRRCASAARPARSPASSGTTCPPTAARSARAAPTTTPAGCRATPGATCASSSWRTPAAACSEDEIPDLVGHGGRERVADRRRGRRRGVRQLGLHVRRLQALHERRLPRRVPDGRADPHRVRDRRAPAGRLQRLRLLRAGVPVRRRRPRARGRPRRQVHALLRPARGRPGARLREGLPDRLDPVRPLRRARRGRRAARRARCTRAASRAPTSTAPPTRRSDQLAGGLGAFFLLTEKPERYGLPAQADSPIQENVVPATLAAMGAGLLAAAGVAAAFLWEKAR